MSIIEYTNGADAEIAQLNAKLDALTAELKAALAEPQAEKHGQRGIERVAAALASAEQITKQKQTLQAQREPLERYALQALELRQARDTSAGYRRAADRARALLAQAERGEAEAVARATNAAARLNNEKGQLVRLGIVTWVNAIERAVGG
jgi:hypothetical protein